MNVKSTKSPFWLRMITILIAVAMTLTNLPVQLVEAATAGFFAPSIYSNSTLTNPGNAYVSDNIYTQTNGNNKSAVYGNFGFNLPAGATINLVEVSVESHGTKNWKVAVSKNNGSSFSAYTTITNTAIDTVTVTGGPGTMWGLTGWTADSFSNANFKVKIATAGGSSSNIAYLDQLKVRVTYTPLNAVATTLVISAPAPGTYGGTVDLEATLKVASSGTPLSGKNISFSLDGFSRGTAVTDGNGVAKLQGVTLTTGLSNTILNVGDYGVEASFSGDGTYALSSDTDLQMVIPRGITVTANVQSKVYGANDPTLTYAFNPALIGSDSFSGLLARTAGENVGAYAITQGTLALSPNYTITYVSANLTITPLGITVTADDKAIHVGNADPPFTFGVSNFIGSDSFTTPPTCGVPGDHTAVGEYPIVCTGGDAGANYSLSYVNGTLTVSDKVILTVSADPQTITYGESDPTFTFTYEGFVDGDDENDINTPPTCGISGAHTNAGAYPSIICTGGSDDKYEFSYTSGTLTVNPLGVTVTAVAKNKIYGAVDPSLTYTFAPALLGTDAFSGALARAAGENVGTYAITQGSLTLGGNYAISYVSADLTIGQASLAVTADDVLLGLGADDPVFTFTYNGFVNNETAEVIDVAPACSVLVPHAELGDYLITCSGGSDNNYAFLFVEGTLSIVYKEADVYLNDTLLGNYLLMPHSSVTPFYDGVAGGPVQVVSKYGGNILASEHRNYQTSFSETLGYPDDQLTTEYWFTRYAYNANVKTWILIANPSGATAEVDVFIGSGPDPIASYSIDPGQSVTPFYDGVAGGPVRVVSTNGVNILASEHRNYQTSFSETLGYPADQLTTEYWFTRYAYNANVKTWILIANPSGSTAEVDVFIGSSPDPIASYSIDPGQTVTPFYDGVAAGPVRVVSTNGVNILASEHRNYQTSFSETLGYPDDQLTTEYWFTRYAYNANVKTWVLIANPQ